MQLIVTRLPEVYGRDAIERFPKQPALDGTIFELEEVGANSNLLLIKVNFAGLKWLTEDAERCANPEKYEYAARNKVASAERAATRLRRQLDELARKGSKGSQQRYVLGRIWDPDEPGAPVDQASIANWTTAHWVANGVAFYVFRDTPENNARFKAAGDNGCEIAVAYFEERPWYYLNSVRKPGGHGA